MAKVKALAIPAGASHPEALDQTRRIRSTVMPLFADKARF